MGQIAATTKTAPTRKDVPAMENACGALEMPLMPGEGRYVNAT